MTALQSEPSRRRPWRPSVRLASLIFGLLAILAIGTFAFYTEYRGAQTRTWVVHSYSVQNELSDLLIELAEARANAFAYLELGDPGDAQAVERHSARALELIHQLERRTSDNPQQTDRLRAAKTMMQAYLARLGRCMVPDGCGRPNSSERRAILEDGAQERRQIAAILHSVQQQEETLLEARLEHWDHLFRRNVLMFALSFTAALLLLLYNFRLQNAEIAKSKALENVQRENAESYRALSGRILELQDAERRKIARDLHDSVGQYLAALKMNLSAMAARKEEGHASALAETLELTDRAIAETRTISHLLHPPLLDELGFQSAATWYTEQFAKRSGTSVNLNLGEIADRLPKEAELALFRVLQESLTNVYRHTKASKVDVSVACSDSSVVLTVRDNGQGIPARVLARWKAGRAAGIGLAGMGERISDLGGTLEVESNGTGTSIRAILPAQRQCETEDKLAS